MLLGYKWSGSTPEMVRVHLLDLALVLHPCNYNIFLSYFDWQNNHHPLKMKILQIHLYPWWRYNSHLFTVRALFMLSPVFLDIFLLCVSLIIELSACSLYLLFHCLINLDRWRALKKKRLFNCFKSLVFLKKGIKQSSWLEVFSLYIFFVCFYCFWQIQQCFTVILLVPAAALLFLRLHNICSTVKQLFSNELFT